MTREEHEYRRAETGLWHPTFGRSRFLRGPGVGIRVETSNFKIGVGVGAGIAGVDGANFEIGTPDPGCANSSAFKGIWE